MTGPDRIELENATGITPEADSRPTMPQPPPVRLVAVEDVHETALRECVGRLERFYIDLFGFELEEIGLERIVLRAANVRLRLDLVESKPVREDYRPIVLEVDSLFECEEKLRAAKIEYERMKGIAAGGDRLLMLDPGGNWVEVIETARVI